MTGLVTERLYATAKLVDGSRSVRGRPGLFWRKSRVIGAGAKLWRSRHSHLSSARIAASEQDSAAVTAAAETEDLAQDEEGNLVTLSVDKVAKNKRRITASISMGSISLETIWSVLTDYEGLADFIPGLASSQILERRENGAQLLQVGEQDLALGVKFRAKGVIEVTELALEIVENGCRRDIGFDMVEGDFKLFRGIWRIEEIQDAEAPTQTQTLLWYILEVQPKVWMPVALIEGRLRNEVSNNLVCVRERALSHETICASASFEKPDD